MDPIQYAAAHATRTPTVDLAFSALPGAPVVPDRPRTRDRLATGLVSLATRMSPTIAAPAVGRATT